MVLCIEMKTKCVLGNIFLLFDMFERYKCQLMCNLTLKDGKMLSFYRKIDSLSTVLNEFEMHSAFY